MLLETVIVDWAICVHVCMCVGSCVYTYMYAFCVIRIIGNIPFAVILFGVIKFHRQDKSHSDQSPDHIIEELPEHYLYTTLQGT